MMKLQSPEAYDAQLQIDIDDCTADPAGYAVRRAKERLKEGIGHTERMIRALERQLTHQREVLTEMILAEDRWNKKNTQS